MMYSPNFVIPSTCARAAHTFAVECFFFVIVFQAKSEIGKEKEKPIHNSRWREAFYQLLISQQIIRTKPTRIYCVIFCNRMSRLREERYISANRNCTQGSNQQDEVLLPYYCTVLIYHTLDTSMRKKKSCTMEKRQDDIGSFLHDNLDRR